MILQLWYSREKIENRKELFGKYTMSYQVLLGTGDAAITIKTVNG